VVHDTGGYCVALYWSMKNLYGIEPGEVWWTARTWLGGRPQLHVYGPLLYGATSILYEGKPVGTPDAGAFWRVISEHKAMRCSPRRPPSAPSRSEDPTASCSSIRPLELPHAVPRRRARRSADHPVGAEACSGVPIVDHWWQTETGWAICGNFRGLEPMPFKPGRARCRRPGWQLEVLDDAGKPIEKPGEVGRSLAKLPLPPGTFPTLWNADERFKQVYLAEYPGYYKTGDAGFIDDRRLRLGDDPGRRRRSTSPAIACRPARSRRCWRATTTSPNAPVSVSPTR
jgi:propionyl-CoA synthetase